MLFDVNILLINSRYHTQRNGFIQVWINVHRKVMCFSLSWLQLFADMNEYLLFFITFFGILMLIVHT